MTEAEILLAPPTSAGHVKSGVPNRRAKPEDEPTSLYRTGTTAGNYTHSPALEGLERV